MEGEGGGLPFWREASKAKYVCVGMWPWARPTTDTHNVRFVSFGSRGKTMKQGSEGGEEGFGVSEF